MFTTDYGGYGVIRSINNNRQMEKDASVLILSIWSLALQTDYSRTRVLLAAGSLLFSASLISNLDHIYIS